MHSSSHQYKRNPGRLCLYPLSRFRDVSPGFMQLKLQHSVISAHITDITNKSVSSYLDVASPAELVVTEAKTKNPAG